MNKPITVFPVVVKLSDCVELHIDERGVATFKEEKINVWRTWYQMEPKLFFVLCEFLADKGAAIMEQILKEST